MAEDFDLFVFEHCDSMLDILSSPDVTTIDAGGQLVPDYPDPPGESCDLGVLSGESGDGGFPQTQALIQVEAVVGTRWTTEWTVTFESLPADFQGLIDEDVGAPHVYFGSSDASGPVAGIFVSLSGIAYSGSLALESAPYDHALPAGPLTVLPGSSVYVELDVPTVIRLVVDGIENIAYLYVTPASEAEASGQRLIAVFTPFQADDMSSSPTDCSTVSTDGSEELPSRIALDAWRMSSSLLVPNQPPVANAGTDQAQRNCSIIQLDGSGSADLETAELTYFWRLINTPLASIYSVNGNDGRTYPLLSPTGFTDLFHSVALGLVHASDELDAGDVLLVADLPYDIIGTGTDGNGFYIQVSTPSIPDGFSAKPFRVFRQRGVSNPDTVRPTFLPDVPGFYRFDLVVADGALESQPSVVVVNIVESALPRGITPRADFVFDYLSDYWNLLEDRAPVATIWSGMMQVAASELYTLWQHDYAKSLRDIQRTFVRRWLHYDLLLGEPLPELTTVRAVYSGVLSQLISSAAGMNIEGTSFTISSSQHETTTVTFLSTDPVEPPEMQAELLNRLREIDPRYTVDNNTYLFPSGYYQAARVNAPFPFTITSSSPAFTTASSGTEGGTCEVVGPRTLNLGTGLVGLDIRENDLLLVDGEPFRVAYVIAREYPENDYEWASQNVVVKEDLPTTATAWKLPSYIRSELIDFYAGLVSAGDEVFLIAQGDDESTLLHVKALGVAEEEPSQLGFELTNDVGNALVDESVEVYLAKIVRRTYVPIDETVADVPTLVELIDIQDDQATLRRNVDYFIEDYRGQRCIRFNWDDDFDPFEGEVPPERLWAEYTYLDNRGVIEDNFGLLAGLTVDMVDALPGDIDYLSAVRGLWYAYVNGPTLRNLRVGAQILLGLPFAEEAGTIEEVRIDFSPTTGRILIRDAERTEIVRSYSFPRTLELETNPATGLPFVAGDAVTQFAPLVKGVEVIDYVSDPTWFLGMLNQGIFYEVQKFFYFLVRVDSTVFGYESLSFVNDFMLQIKPTYTYPFFLISQQIGDTEISITDTVEMTATLSLLDGICGVNNPHSTSLDDARASGPTAFWNQLDTDSSDGTPPPTFPTSDTVEWALDRYVFCPEDSALSHACQLFAAPALPSTGLNFVEDEDLFNDARFLEAGPFTVANGATGEAITAEAGATVPANGTIERLRVLISGGPGADPAAYELVVAIDGVDTLTQAFTSVLPFTDLSFTVSQAVTATDVLTARIRHAGGASRSPAWTHVRVEVGVNLGAWDPDSVSNLPVGNYCFNRDLV